MKPQKLASVMTAITKKDGGISPEGEEGENHALMAVAEDLIRAVHGKDAKAVSVALESAFDIIGIEKEAQPDDEGMGEV